MDIFEVFKKHTNEERAEKMSAYMKYQFPFLGIPAPTRKEISSVFLKEKKSVKKVDWDFILVCYDRPEREFQYLAISYLDYMKGFLQEEDISRVEELITTKSWWDSVDALNNIIGYLCMKFPQLKSSVSLWRASDDIWLKRVSIIFQLKYKENTDVNILSETIVHNQYSKEFFVNKAIGWALREYSKTNKDWVRDFISTHDLSNLSKREASKYL